MFQSRTSHPQSASLPTRTPFWFDTKLVYDTMTTMQTVCCVFRRSFTLTLSLSRSLALHTLSRESCWTLYEHLNALSIHHSHSPFREGFLGRRFTLVRSFHPSIHRSCERQLWLRFPALYVRARPKNKRGQDQTRSMHFAWCSCSR